MKAFIEIQAGGGIKYEVNEKTGELEVDRFLYTSFVYPFNYGYIQGTTGEDGDPLDVVLLSQLPIQPGATIEINAIGLLEMEDEEGIDNKIIAVPMEKIDPEFGAIIDINEVSKPTLAKIKHFFEHYKALEPDKWVKVRAFKGKTYADAEIGKAGGRTA